MLSFLKKKLTTFLKKKVVTSAKVKPSEKVDKGSKILDKMKKVVVIICRKYLDNFEGQSKGSTGWFNLYHEFKKINNSTLEPEFYSMILKRTLKVNILKCIKRL